MNQWIRFSEFDATNERKVARVKDFLDRNDLILSDDVELYVTASEEGEIVACGGISGKILKCVAVTPRLRGQRFVLKVIDALLEAAKKRGQEELFLFSSPKNQSYFEEHGFKLIERSGDEVILMENSDNLEKYQESLKKYKKEGSKIASMVVCDSLVDEKDIKEIESISNQSDWLHLFIVCNNGVYEKADFEKLSQKLEYLKNVTVHENSDYLISKATFPTYFIKDKAHLSALHAELDLKIFKNHIAPILGITHRYVGSKNSLNTIYLQTMKRIFAQSDKSPSIEVGVFK
jgi:[citrate (pro-3S)-lyase] ligase